MDKYRYFAFLVYPETAPVDWKKQLKDTYGMYAISPLHDPDEEQTKPHFHVIYKHPNTVSLDAAKRCIPDNIPANGFIIPLHHPRVYQRYLIHLDDIGKQQFQDGYHAIETLNGFPLDLRKELSETERFEIRSRVFDFIEDNAICEYCDLLNGLQSLGDADMFDYAFNHTIAFNAYLKSKRHSSK